MKIKKEIEVDLNDYRVLCETRKNLIDENPELFKNYFSLVHLTINILLKYQPISKEKIGSSIEYVYRKRIVENIIQTIDMINFKDLDSAAKCYRSIIEAHFKYILECERIKIYNKNTSEGVFEATEELKELKSKVSSHKIGKLTRFVLTYFPGEEDYILLNEKYSDLSSIVHISSDIDGPLNISQLDYIRTPKEIKLYMKDFIYILEIVIKDIIRYKESIYNSKVITRENFLLLEKLIGGLKK